MSLYIKRMKKVLLPKFIWVVPPGKLTVCEMENGLIEIVDASIKHGGSVHSYVKLLEGMSQFIDFS